MDASPVHRIQLGQTFDSFMEYYEHITLFQNENFTQMYKRNTRKIAASKTKKAIKAINAKTDLKLIYDRIVYNCIHGGRTFTSKGKGARPNQRYVIYFCRIQDTTYFDFYTCKCKQLHMVKIHY